MPPNTEGFFTTPDGAQLWYSLSGEGDRTVVLNDGLGCDGFAWKYVLPGLARDWRVLRWHYRGHGQSGLAQDPLALGVEYCADDLALLVQALDLGTVFAVGHSMGVQVALELHRRHPTLVQGLALICGSYGRPLDTFHDNGALKLVFPFVKAAVERLPSVAKLIAENVVDSRAALVYTLLAEVNARLVRVDDLRPYFQHLGHIDPLVFFRTLAAAADHSAWDHLPGVNVPTLIIAGEKDRFTPMYLSERMHAAIPGSEILISRTGTHVVTLEMPELVTLRLDRFLRDHPPRTARKPASRRSRQGSVAP